MHGTQMIPILDMPTTFIFVCTCMFTRLPISNVEVFDWINVGSFEYGPAA
jgi:hypothetical protein